MRDIYDPPPAPEHDLATPAADSLNFTSGDLVWLVALCAVLFVVSAAGWRDEPALAVATAAAGSLIIVESWLTALAFLHRGPPLGLKARLLIFVEALVPWLLGLAAAVAVILALFWIVDHLG